MKKWFYFRLAVEGIRKNSRLYYPYLLTNVLMTVLLYIMVFLSHSEQLSQMSGGGNTQQILYLGTFVIMIFAVLFLFYSNAFLVRRRMKEFGLYNILGMNKRKIGRVLFCETLVIYGFSMVMGLTLGIALSKLAELGLMNLIQGKIVYTYEISAEALVWTLVTFAAIHLLVFLNGIRRVGFSSAISLVRSENAGEKPPKANWLLGILGFGLLGAAYGIAVSIEQPIEALLFFLAATIMVILATYLVFIAGSVFLCRVLQKNKSYYYNRKHFVSVSSMAYRMKRNGAGLASICILLTMILVMISSSASLFFAKEDCIRAQYPYDVCNMVYHYGYCDADEEITEKLDGAVADVVASNRLQAMDAQAYYEYNISGYLEDNQVRLDLNPEEMAMLDYSNVTTVHFIQLEDYNRMYGKQAALADGEALACFVKMDELDGSLQVGDAAFRIAGTVPKEELDFQDADDSVVFGHLFLIVKDMKAAVAPLTELCEPNGSHMLLFRWFNRFNCENSVEQQMAAVKQIGSQVEAIRKAETRTSLDSQRCVCRAESRADFYDTFGGLFFIGILLSIAFLLAAVLIIYYKQISEGYEDQGRFEIMQKVGMTKKDIRQTINSQMLTVFFMPILFAALHVCFAFPVVNKMLMLFGLFNTGVQICTLAGCMVVCTIFYAVVYKLTSRAYFSIVSAE